jgi:hypothetical protein
VFLTNPCGKLRLAYQSITTLSIHSVDLNGQQASRKYLNISYPKGRKKKRKKPTVPV